MSIRNWLLIVLGACAVLVVLGKLAGAQDKPIIGDPQFKLSTSQADHVKVLQLEAREAFRDLIEAQQRYQPKLKAMQDYCNQVIKENKWPDDTTCSAITFSSPDQLLGQDISFFKKPAQPAKSEPPAQAPVSK